MVAEAITEAFPEDRSFFRIANQLGKQQGYEPEKLQNTARVHWMWRWWRFRKAFARREERTLNAPFSRSGDVCVHAPSRLRPRSGRMVVFNLLE